MVALAGIYSGQANAYINISQNVTCANIDEALGNLNIDKICGEDEECIKQAQKKQKDLEHLKKNCDDAKAIVDKGREKVDENIEIVKTSDSFVDTGVAGATVAVQGALAEGTNAVTKTMTALSGYDSSKETSVSYIADSNMTCLNVTDKIKELEKGKYSSSNETVKKAKEEALAKLNSFKQQCDTLKKAFPNSMEAIDDKADKDSHFYNSDAEDLRVQANHNNDTVNMLKSQAESGNTLAASLLDGYQTKQGEALQANSNLASEYYSLTGATKRDTTAPGNLMASTANYDRAQKQNTDIEANMTKEDIEKAKENGAYDTTDEQLEEARNKNFEAKRGDNSKCSIPSMQKMYQSSCYSCKIIMTLITTFMNACARVYDLTRDAGVKVLVIGSMLWLAAFALKLVSAFTNQEPMSIIHTLFVFMFKVASAYIVITIGIGVIVNLFVNPLLMAGADYGLGLLQAANQSIIKVATTSQYAYGGTEIISANVINKIMALTEGIDKTVSTNLVIGHALTCHSFNAGMLTYTGPLEGLNVTIQIPDIWIWLCGAAIWFCGFMLTLGVGYYLLDVCFKIGFCIIALPIVIGLWPFGPTSSKFNSCMSIIFRSAGLFAFLALTVSYALSLISASLGDLSTFYAKIKAGDAEWVSNTFSITGSQFILIMFAYIYGIKMVGATVSGYVGKFFSDSVFGGASPMHMKATQMTDFAKKKVTQAASFAGGVVTHQASRAAGAVVGGAIDYAKGKVHGGKSSGGGGAASGGMKAAGQGMEAAGEGMEAAGKGVEAAGKGVSAAGKGISSAAQAANVIPVAGQAIAAAGAAAGAAVQAAGAATQAAGKGVQAAGKATKAAGKVTQNAAKGVGKVEQGVGAVKNSLSGDDHKED